MSIYESRLELFLDRGLFLILVGVICISFFLTQRLQKIDWDLNFGETFLMLFTVASVVAVLVGIGYLIPFILIFVCLVYLIEISKISIAYRKVFQVSRSTSEKFQVVLIVLFTGFLLITSSVQIHYDYFHQFAYSIDIANNIRSPSRWLQEFDPTYWPIKTQTILPGLDAIEIFFGRGYINNSLALIFVAMLMIVIMWRLKCQGVNRALFLFCLCIYLWDFAHTPRPHILVGLACCMLMISGGRFLARCLSLAILILAKRDGLIVVLIMGVAWYGYFLFSKNYLKSSLRFVGAKKIIHLLVILLLFLCAYYFSQWVPIKGHTISDIFRQIIVGADFSILDSLSVQIVVGITAIVLLKLFLSRSEQVPVVAVLVIAAVLIHLVLSALTLMVLNQFNEGTINRKLVYILLPCMLVFLSNNWSAHDKIDE